VRAKHNSRITKNGKSLQHSAGGRPISFSATVFEIVPTDIIILKKQKSNLSTLQKERKFVGTSIACRLWNLILLLLSLSLSRFVCVADDVASSALFHGGSILASNFVVVCLFVYCRGTIGIFRGVPLILASMLATSKDTSCTFGSLLLSLSLLASSLSSLLGVWIP